MIRHLHPTDAVLLFPFRQAAGRAQAFTLPRTLEPEAPLFPALRYAGIALSLRAWQACWVLAERGRIDALIHAGRRAGRGTWEVRDLFVRPDSTDRCVDLLEEMCVQAGRDGARRLFMRVASGSDVLHEARRAGFVAYLAETAYRSEAARPEGGAAVVLPRVRARAKSDDAGLLRLHCAWVPATRRAYGPANASEWRDTEERAARIQEEWVLEDEAGRVAAWLRTAETKSGRFISITADPDAGPAVGELVLVGLDGAEGRPAVALAASADATLASALESAGFAAARSFDVLVRPVAAPVGATRRAVAPVG
ncbi:MAG: hypothetical protein FJ313_03220 [Gemmatimonadetes bacterium]|nr:hypothetical protein [Gemmatimonadota bacterium]